MRLFTKSSKDAPGPASRRGIRRSCSRSRSLSRCSAGSRVRWVMRRCRAQHQAGQRVRGDLGLWVGVSRSSCSQELLPGCVQAGRGVAMVLLDDSRLGVNADVPFSNLSAIPRWACSATRLVGGAVGGKAEPSVTSRVRRSSCARTAIRRDPPWGADIEVVTGHRLQFLFGGAEHAGGGIFSSGSARARSPGLLSEREREVRLVAHGRAGPEIADELHPPATPMFRTHVSNAMTKMGARSRALSHVAKALGAAGDSVITQRWDGLRRARPRACGYAAA